MSETPNLVPEEPDVRSYDAGELVAPSAFLQCCESNP